MNRVEVSVGTYWHLSNAWRRGINAEGLTYGGTIERLNLLRSTPIASETLPWLAWSLQDLVIEDRIEAPLLVGAEIIPFVAKHGIQALVGKTVTINLGHQAKA